MDDEVSRFAQTFQTFMEKMNEAAWAGKPSPVRDLLDRHLEADSSQLPVVSETFETYDHANVQVGLSAYLEAEGRSHDLVGLTGQQRHFESLSDLLHTSHMAGVGIGSVDLVNLPVSPDETLACVQFGIFLIDDGGTRLAVLMRGPTEFGPRPSLSLEVLCADQERARALLAEVRRLTLERNVFRRQVISFGEAHMGHVGVGPVIFHRRPELQRDQLILPERVLELIERQVLGIARHRDRLRASGQHVKRGLLLYGPPGNGKTLTVSYVVSQAPEHTVLLLTGGSLQLLRPACGLARTLQPAIVILEDVDLVAEERWVMGHQSNPILFDLLNELDGMAEDADVAFILTTNRADALEPALAARPGRVDLALELELPDEDARRRLIDLYGRGLELHVEDLTPVIEQTEGVAASFIKELMRRAALLATDEPDGVGPLVVTDAHIRSALDEFLDQRDSLTQRLLGGPGGRHEPPRPGSEWLVAGGAETPL